MSQIATYDMGCPGSIALEETPGAPLPLDSVKGAIGGVAAWGEQVHYTVSPVVIAQTTATLPGSTA